MTPIDTHTAVRSPSGLAFEINANGSLRRALAGDLMLNLFVGNEVEGGPANLWLRRHDAAGVQATALLGPGSPGHIDVNAQGLVAHADWQGLAVAVRLVLAADEPAWFWHVDVRNTTAAPCTVDLIHAQDVGLAAYGAVRLNEYYVSQYVDHQPLQHARHGWMLASRQNQPVAGRHPWLLMGALRHGVSYATDALQWHGLTVRDGGAPAALATGLPGTRLQHEHAMVVLQEQAVTLAPGEHAGLGFFGRFEAHHAAASGPHDLALAEATLALPEARTPQPPAASIGAPPATTLFSQAPMLLAADLDDARLDVLFGPRRHEERDAGGLLSFFAGDDAHVVLRAKERQVLRPHGHMLRTGGALVPDETALASTVWMAGVFHSMVTQGHVSINRFLSTTHSYLGLFRSHGQRVFVDAGGGWQLLGVPSAFEMQPSQCRWLYRHGGGLLEVRSVAVDAPQALELHVRVLDGAPVRVRVTHHVALGGDDGSAPGPARWSVADGAVYVATVPDTELGRRFPRGAFAVEPIAGTRFTQVGGDELLFDDGRSRGLPFVCVDGDASPAFALRLAAGLVPAQQLPAPDTLPLPRLQPPAASDAAADVAQLADILPWYAHNALVHYLAPRGLEQYSGGGWGTRDVCQGPLEMLLALGRTQAVRDLLLRVFAAQNADGDWPQWFMFFDRERDIRAPDSHGDIVYWPLLGLARYLEASGDAALLDATLPFHGTPGHATVWEHVQRALAVIARRQVPGTHLAAYGHGDWNDALQPADPALRERLCSAWTVTLHHETLTALGHALRDAGRTADADRLAAEARDVLADFQRLLLPDGVLAGYAMWDRPGDGRLPAPLLHPRDTATGVHYSLLPMMHAVLADMLTPQQARDHVELMQRHLHGPDGARLFDRPLPYHGGLMKLFQRGESASFFGREIGIMYTHAHLRHAQMLAHLGDAPGLLDALRRAHPILLRQHVPSAAVRQSNCYFSSSDATFADRYDADRRYDAALAGDVPLEGGWRIYSSGPGLFIAMFVRHFLGLRVAARSLTIDPVIPPTLDGLRATVALWGKPVDVSYAIGGTPGAAVEAALNGTPLSGARVANRYRDAGLQVGRDVFEAALQGPHNRLRVVVGPA
jgi:cellobiose phosphorylase